MCVSSTIQAKEICPNDVIELFFFRFLEKCSNIMTKKAAMHHGNGIVWLLGVDGNQIRIVMVKKKVPEIYE